MTSREDALSHLYTRLIGSRDGYRSALERAESPAIEAVLAERVERREADAAQIRQFLAGAGVHPSDDGPSGDGSTLAAAHRAFLSLKDRVAGSGDAALLREIARGEEALLDAYKAALASSNATDPEVPFLRDQRDGTRATVEDLRARAEAA